MSQMAGAVLSARLRRWGRRQVAVLAALAVAVVVPVLIETSTRITTDATLGRALADLPVGTRTAIVSFNGFLDPDELTDLDRLVRQRLPDLTTGQVRRQLEYRTLSDNAGTDFVLAASDALGEAVHLVSGRMPTGCTARRCEVVEIVPGTGEFASATPDVEDLGLVVVGTVERADPLLLSGTFDPGPELPLLLADGVQAAAQVQALELIGRSYGWVATLDRTVILAGGEQNWSERIAAVADQVGRARPGTALTVPEREVGAELERAHASARRFGLLAAGCGLLLLGVALIGGAALRPDTLRFAEALRRRGLDPVRIHLVLALEALALVALAAVLGLGAGALLSAPLLGAAGLPVGSGVRAALSGAAGWVAGLLALAYALFVLVLRPDASRSPTDPRTAWRALTWGTLACLGGLALVVSRGDADPIGDRQDPLLILLPVLVLLAAALAAARFWPALLWALTRWLPRRAVGTRLAVAGITTRPLLAASCLALLVAAIGATGFAASYRATLRQGAEDQAAFTVPTDARITTGADLHPVLSTATVADYAATTPGAIAIPVARQTGSLAVGTGRTEPVQLVGIDPDGLTRVHRWSAVVGADRPAQVAAAIAATEPDPGLALPTGRRLSLLLTRDLPAVEVIAELRADDGRERSLRLVADGRALTGDLPSGSGWSLSALSIGEPEWASNRRQHQLGESTTTATIPAGTIGWGEVSVDGSALEHPWTDWNGPGMRIGKDGSTAVLDYRLTASTVEVWASAALAGTAGSPAAIAVLADQETAAQSPTLTLTVAGQDLRVRVVAVAPRFPTVSGRFVVADLAALAPALSRISPGTGQPGEIWLALPGSGDDVDFAAGPGQASAGQVRAALAQAPFAGPALAWSAELEQSLRTDPVAEGAQRVLFLSALATLAVALVAVVLLTVAERTEDAAQFQAWEADGVRPGMLRRVLWIRAVLITLAAVPAGAAAGLGLGAATARLVRATAGAQVPQPPLVPVLGADVAVPLVLGAGLLALGAAGVFALGSFRQEQSPW